MTANSPQPTSLADRALQRLRQVATGNGLEPAAITLLETQESTFVLHGKMEISPLCESNPSSYPGPVKGKDRKSVGSLAALQEAVLSHGRSFKESSAWIEAATEEIKTHSSQGWGLEDAKVTLSQHSAIFAVSQNCPTCAGRQMLTCTQCLGNGTVVCTQCQGKGRETCYYCGGRGENPQQPGQPCTTCNGTRFAPCRFCQSRGHLACPTCQGRRGTPCTTCQATGKITQEVEVVCSAETHFSFKGEELPSGLRRGLDRIGISNLTKGHADITSEPPSEEELEASATKPRVPILNYTLTIPYAELRMGLGKKKAVVSAVGKRCAIMGVPAFLDESLKPWRAKLRLAAEGKASLDEALEARAMKELLTLTVAGKGHIENVRKLYPYGLSQDAIKSILSDMRLALNKTTLKTRSLIAVLCVTLCAIAFYMIFVTGVESQLTLSTHLFVSASFDLALLALALGLSWATLSFSARFVLKRRFPQLKLALNQKIGKTGLAMLVGIGIVYVAAIYGAPIHPAWLQLFHH